MQELRDLPARVTGLELQIVQLRSEMHEAFSATRADLRSEMHGIRDEVRENIRSGVEETQRFMRVLDEDVLSRLALIDEVRGDEG